MKIRNILALVLCAALLLCGCDSVLPANGTLDIKADDVDRVEITDMLVDGNTFTVQDREIISKLVRYINSYTLEGATEPLNGSVYHLSLVGADGEISGFTIVSESEVSTGGLTYAADAKELLQYVEALECDTMTDSELIDSLLTGDTLNRLSVIGEDGKISLDKIAGLTASCPALFELLSRPSAIESVGTYGIESIQTALESSDIDLRERAEALAEIVKEYLPDFSEQIDQLLEK